MKSRQRFDQINIIPYVDVLLVLLLVFMVAAPMMHHRLSIDLPKAKATKSIATKAPIWYMNIDSKGRYFLGKDQNPRHSMSVKQLPGRIRLLKQGVSKMPSVQIRAEKSVSYQILISALTAFKDQGIDKMSFVYKS
jgi:biopolymer transport protein ExbD